MSKLAEQLCAMGFKSTLSHEAPKIMVTRLYRGRMMTMPLSSHLTLDYERPKFLNFQ